MTDETERSVKRKRVKYNAMTTDVIVRNYRLLDPLDWGEDCEAELRRMTALWNRLVEIDNGHRRSYRAATADDPTVKALRERYDTLSAAVDGLIAERKAVRARARKRVPTPVEKAKSCNRRDPELDPSPQQQRKLHLEPLRPLDPDLVNYVGRCQQPLQRLRPGESNLDRAIDRGERFGADDLPAAHGTIAAGPEPPAR
jgi:hypothetical protein